MHIFPWSMPIFTNLLVKTGQNHQITAIKSHFAAQVVKLFFLMDLGFQKVYIMRLMRHRVITDFLTQPASSWHPPPQQYQSQPPSYSFNSTGKFILRSSSLNLGFERMPSSSGLTWRYQRRESRSSYAFSSHWKPLSFSPNTK